MYSIFMRGVPKWRGGEKDEFSSNNYIHVDINNWKKTEERG